MLKNWEEKLSLYIEGAMSPDEMLEIEAELEKNEALQIKHDNLKMTMQAVRDMPSAELPFGLQHKMLKAAGRGKRRNIMRSVAAFGSVAAVAAFVFIMIHIHEDATPGLRFDTGIANAEHYETGIANAEYVETGIGIAQMDTNLITPDFGMAPEGRLNVEDDGILKNILHVESFYDIIDMLGQLPLEIVEINPDQNLVTIRFFRTYIDEIENYFQISNFIGDYDGYWTAHLLLITN